MIMRSIPPQRKKNAALRKQNIGGCYSRNILQARHLLDEEKCALTRQRFGALTGKYVLYLGEKTDIGGISYRNVEKFLKRLPAFTMRETDEAEQPDLGPAL
ncbi:MAG: hypothetical protein ACLSVG_02620 [Clostridia bacterium]